MRRLRAGLLLAMPWMLLIFGSFTALHVVEACGFTKFWDGFARWASLAFFSMLGMVGHEALRRLKAAKGDLVPRVDGADRPGSNH